MTVESATYVDDLDDNNPSGSQVARDGDNHIALIKTVLKATFPNADRAFPIPTTTSKTASFSVVAGDQNKTFLIDTSGGAVTATLPALAAGDAGFKVYFLKTNTDTDPYFIAPPSGTIQSGAISGLSKTRRAIPGVQCYALWTGTAWIASRAVDVPVGSCLSFDGASLPVGYEWPSGQTLTSASSNYPDFYSANGSSGDTVDRRGRVDVGKDNMGGSVASRITNAIAGFIGTTLGAAGGDERLQDHVHNYEKGVVSPNNAAIGGLDHHDDHDTVSTGNPTTAKAGGNSGNVQPSVIVNKILVVE